MTAWYSLSVASNTNAKGDKMKNNFNEYLERKQKEHGEKFDKSDLNADFIFAYESGERVEVQFRNDKGVVYETKRGRIGITTGWKPCFLLMLTRRSIGSSYTIGKKEVIKSYVCQ